MTKHKGRGGSDTRTAILTHCSKCQQRFKMNWACLGGSLSSINWTCVKCNYFNHYTCGIEDSRALWKEQKGQDYEEAIKDLQAAGSVIQIRTQEDFNKEYTGNFNGIEIGKVDPDESGFIISAKVENVLKTQTEIDEEKREDYRKRLIDAGVTDKKQQDLHIKALMNEEI